MFAILGRVETKLGRLLFLAKLACHGLYGASRIFSHTTLRERKQLYDLARQCRVGANVLEIGSHVGSSACFLAAGLIEPNGHLFCVDTWNNETMPDGVRDTYAEFERNVAAHQRRITTVRKRSIDVRADDLRLPLDLVFLDGDHSEPAVRADFALVVDWLRPAGTIVFHDCLYFEGISKVIGECLSSGRFRLSGYVDSMLWITKDNLTE